MGEIKGQWEVCVNAALDGFALSGIRFFLELQVNSRKVVSSSMSQLVAHFQIFRRLMKGKFDAHVL